MDGVEGLDESKVAGNHAGSLVNELIKGMLTIGSWLSSHVVDTVTTARDILEVGCNV